MEDMRQPRVVFELMDGQPNTVAIVDGELAAYDFAADLAVKHSGSCFNYEYIRREIAERDSFEYTPSLQFDDDDDKAYAIYVQIPDLKHEV